jgi:HEAT repeat protein
MTEFQQGKIQPAIIAKLNSGNESEILHAIDKIRVSGKPEYLPYLMPLLNKTSPVIVKDMALELLGDLKDPKAIPYLIDAINNEDLILCRKELVACCWQNGLDFSIQLPFFVDLVINNEFEIAFEAFTVIENLEFFPSEEIRLSEIHKIDNAIVTAMAIKANLFRALRSLLSASHISGDAIS